MNYKLGLMAVALVCTFALSCNHTKPPAAASDAKRYRFTGRVVAIDKANKSLTVDGDEIPGFMSAMQMPYDVRDASLLNNLSPGDKIVADVVVKEDESWLENIRVTQPAAPAAKPTSSARRVKRSVA